MIGNIPKKILEAFIETIPLEFSILDENDEVLAWNKHESRVFKRPESVLGRDVRDCHPRKSLEYVERILNEMKDGIRERARFWIDLAIDSFEHKQKILIEYYALRDSGGKYLGCVEVSQNISEIQGLKGEKRLID